MEPYELEPYKTFNFVLKRGRTSVRLELDFWQGIKDITRQRAITIHQLMREVDENRDDPNLTSAIRIYVLNYYRSRAYTVQSGD